MVGSSNGAETMDTARAVYINKLSTQKRHHLLSTLAYHTLQLFPLNRHCPTISLILRNYVVNKTERDTYSECLVLLSVQTPLKGIAKRLRRRRQSTGIMFRIKAIPLGCHSIRITNMFRLATPKTQIVKVDLTRP